MQNYEDTEETEKKDKELSYLKCPLCQFTTWQRGAIQSHLKTHQPRKCRHCGILVFKTRKRPTGKELLIHERSCYRRIQRDLKEQQQEPKVSKKYHCKTCSKIFDRQYYFRIHPCLTECVHCKQIFKHMTAVKNHKCPTLKPKDFRNLKKDLEVRYVSDDS